MNSQNQTTQISNLQKNEEIHEGESRKIINKNKMRGKYIRKFLIRSQIYFLMTVFSRISKSNKKYSKQPIFNKEPKNFKLLIEPKKQKN